MKKPGKESRVRTLVVDPESRTVTEHYVADALEHWQRIVGGNIEYLMALPETKDDVWANEIALLTSGPHYWWCLLDSPLVISGRAFIARFSGQRQKFSDAKASLEQAEKMITFLTKEEARVRFAAMQQLRRAAHERRKAELGDTFHYVFVESRFPEN